MAEHYSMDSTDARLLLALAETPRATTVALADRVGASRNTVQTRLSRLEEGGGLRSFEHRIDPESLGYGLKAFVFTNVTQRKLSRVAEALDEIPEVIQVDGLSGVTDLLVHVVARDADDLYRVAGRILDIKGVKRTSTSLVMRELVDYRIQPLLHRLSRTRRPRAAGTAPPAARPPLD